MSICPMAQIMSYPIYEPNVDFSVLCTPKIDENIHNPLIFFENGYLLMWYGFLILKVSCKQACVDFWLVTLGIIT